MPDHDHDPASWVAPAAVREARFPQDSAVVSRLVAAYLRRTESEKAERALADERDDGSLPARYQSEVDDPAAAFASSTVLLGVADREAVAMVVLSSEAGAASIARFWVDPVHRGHGVGRRLLAEALARLPRPVRLSVWDWRTPAIRTYERSGFAVVPSWESRERLVCMELRPDSIER
ncbi:GNAT family N-acetyltransferase [Sanguibacter sp. 4.1]|uniref:GNAT family N-acetyltransferase n=1 Tax=Sanguibacter biliveldensis TaxID=3030830 RepID=A0AAF1C037_9MICO|nr:GNAT family N-acetyltransferase [Sanguibacter sp. 4.1]WPF83747.1 GNAT family N-acetyltransferase [Sanguibacter sp. 4.1]